SRARSASTKAQGPSILQTSNHRNRPRGGERLRSEARLLPRAKTAPHGPRVVANRGGPILHPLASRPRREGNQAGLDEIWQLLRATRLPCRQRRSLHLDVASLARGSLDKTRRLSRSYRVCMARHAREEDLQCIQQFEDQRPPHGPGADNGRKFLRREPQPLER